VIRALRPIARPALPPLASILVVLAAAPAQAGTLPYAAALGRCYDAVLDARFDDAESEIARACGPAPAQACELMRATALWWRIQMDPYNQSLDGRFQTRIDAVIGSIERWTAAEPRRADAWFLLGASYGLRVQYRVLRGERLAAARDGKRIKDSLERSLALDPNLQDAYFGIGLYHYYAAIAPAALRLLRWLLFLPGGDRVQGLQEMVRARDRGELLRGEADYQLSLIYLWYEQDAGRALALLEELHARYPHNPVFLQSIADVQDAYLHDNAASLDTWRAMFNLAKQRRLSFPEPSEVRARIGIAVELDALFETDSAIEELRLVVDAKPPAPYEATSRALVRLGMAYDRMGQRPQALAAYRSALASAPPDDPEGVRALARAGIARQPDARTAEAYRLSIEGWRHLQRGELGAAAESLGRSAALNPGDPVTRFRLALLSLARNHGQDALAAFEGIVAARPAPPPTILASSCVEAGRLLEGAGNRARAIEMFQRATRVRGAGADTKRTAEQALARLRVPLTTFTP
jgi:tetratricopeptide (TPR) repeat protein